MLRTVIKNRCLIVILLLFGSGMTFGQRTLVNSSFEDWDVTNGGCSDNGTINGSSYCVVHEDSIPSWETTSSDNQIEVWQDGFLDVPAQDGGQFIEINATEPATLTTWLCLVDGEVINWSFWHRGRKGVDVINLTIDGVNQGNFTTDTLDWVNYTGMFTATRSGIHNLEFTAVSSTGGDASQGNFLDNIIVTGLTPYIEFSRAAYSGVEDANEDIPRILVEGLVATDIVAQVNVTGGTATAGTDFNNTVNVTIPAGVYDGSIASSIPVNLQILPDNLTENNETIALTLTAPAGSVEVNDVSGCQSSVESATTYTIFDNDTSPAQGNETVTTVEDGFLRNIDLDNNNTDPDGDPLTLSFPNGLIGTGGGTFVDNGNGTVNYTTKQDFYGVDTLAYVVCDNDMNCVNDTLFVRVIPINDIPNQGNETLTTTEDATTVTSGDLVANNTDPDETTVTISMVVSSTGGGTTAITTGGTTLDYTPLEDFNGVDTVIYTVCDGDVPTPNCVNDTLFVTVTPVNDDPNQGNETLTTMEDVTTTSGNLVSNNVDPDGTAVTISTVVSSTGGGTTSITNGGTALDYTPLEDFNGIDTVIYTVCDGDSPASSCVNDTLFVTVTSVDDNPDQGNETLMTTEDATTITSGNLVSNNVDPDGTAVTISTVVSSTGGGTTSITNGGTTLDYTPLEDFNGVDTVIYTVCDGDSPASSCVNDTLFVTVTSVDDNPDQGNETLTTTEDATTVTSGNLVSNNVDPDGTAVTISTVVSSTGGGTTSITNGGTTLDYTPLEDFNGVDTVVYEVCDQDSPTPSCINDTLFVMVSSVNDDPNQGNETLTTMEDVMTTSGNLVSNNVDPDGTAVTISTVVSSTGGGTTAITNGGTALDYTPLEDFNGVDTVVYEVCDGDSPASSCVNDTLFVTVTSVDDNPGQGNETLTTTEDATTVTSGNLVSNNVDPDGTAVTISTVVSSTGGGTTAITNGGTTLDYTPLEDFNGVDTIVYEVCDQDSPTPSCINDTLFVMVSSVNDDPNQGNENLSVTKGTSKTSGNLVSNNVDPDGTAVTISTVVSSTGGGTTSITNGGTTINYTSIGNFDGVDTVIYEVCDQDSPTPSCVNDTLFVTVKLGEDPSQGNETLTTTEDAITVTSGNLVTNNVDPDGTAVTISTVVSSTGGGTTSITNGGTTLDYTPLEDFNGVDTVVYEVCDEDRPTPSCVNDTLFVTVTPVNDDIAQGSETLTITEDTTTVTSENLVLNNVDPDGTAVTISTVVSSTGGGTTSITNGGTTLDYTPLEDFNGVDTVIYTVCDEDSPTPSCVNDTLFVTVSSVDDNPNQGNETLTTTEDATTVTSGDLVSNNVDPDGTAVTISTVVSSTGGGTTAITNGGTTLDYTPLEDFNGVDTVVYEVCDQDSPTPSCINDTLFVTVSSVNDDPNQGNENLSVTKGTSETSGNLVVNNVDPDGTAVTISTVVSTTGGGTTAITNGGTTINYTSIGNFDGVDTVIYEVCDQDSPTPSCVNDTLFVTVKLGEDPSQGNEILTTTEDATALTSGDLVSNNVDPDGTAVTISTVVSTTGGGTTSITNGGTTLDYTPLEDFNGVDTVIYTVCDEDSPTPSCVNDTLFVTVTPVNDDIAQGSETLTTTEDATTVTSGNLVTNNVDPDGTAVTISTVVSSTGGGTTSITNGGTTLDYTPLEDFNGVDTVIYTVCDEDSPTPSCVNDTLFVTVTSVDDDPSQGNETLTTTKNATALTSGNLVANNVDPDGTAVTISTVVSSTGGGTTSITNGGTTLDYTPLEDFDGVDTVIYTVCDEDSPTPSCVNDTLFVMVAAVSNGLSQGNETLTTTEDATALTSGNLVSNNVDPDGTAVTISTVVSSTGGGTTSITNGGTTLDYTPLEDFNGVDTVIYTVCDEDSPTPSCVNDTLFVTVTSVDDDPNQGNETLTTTKNATALTSGNLVSNNVDPDGTAVTISTVVSSTGGGTTSITNGGTTLDYTPLEDFDGADTVIYTVCDEDSPTPSCVNDTLFVMVAAVSNGLSQGNETLTTTEDATALTSGNLVSNNVDPDGTAVTISTVVSSTGGGTTTITNGGTTVDYTPLEDFNGVDTVIYTVCDEDAPTPSCVNDTLFVTVTSVDDDPSQGSETLTITEDGNTVTSQNLVSNNVDPDGTEVVISMVVSSTGGGIISVTNNGTTLDYTPLEDFNGVDTVVYTVCDGDSPVPSCVNDTLFVTVTTVNTDATVSYYNGFSPDGNGQNDVWTIKNIQFYPDNTVMIFNRWGNKVWEETGYNNSTIVWDGTSNTGLSVGNQLPDGTYFYVVEYKNNQGETVSDNAYVIITTNR